MTEALLSESTTAVVVSYLYYLLLTSHVCLFVDSSRWQKYPVSRFNHVLASLLAALPATIISNTFNFSSTSIEVAIGISTAVILSTAITLVIQRVINFDFGG